MINLKEYNSGTYQKGYGYEYFMPTKVNDDWTWEDSSINQLLEKAAVRLGELNSFAQFVPNIDLFIQLHVTKEAVISSRIEGTQTKIDEALLPQEEISPERRNDWKEVNNYVQAMNEAIQELNQLPISSRLIKKIHKTLLKSVRGEHKLPGEFRTSQNWIGGASLADATFIPPHHDYVQEIMGDLENFIHNQNLKVPDLIKIAIVHYQFETIHPFLDGNGRIGRLLITLFLVSENILSKPLLYLSKYFERNKGLYYDNLTFVRTKNEMRQWIKYFLVGIEQTAQEAVDTLNKVLNYKTETEELVRNHFGRRTANAMMVLEQLLINPVTNVERIEKLCDVSYKTANDLVKDFVKHNILKEMTGQSRNRMFVLDKYLKLFEG